MKLYIQKIWSNVKLKALIVWRGRAGTMVQFNGAEVGPFAGILDELVPRRRHLRLVGGTAVPETQPRDYRDSFPGLKQALERLTDAESSHVAAHKHSEAISKG